MVVFNNETWQLAFQILKGKKGKLKVLNILEFHIFIDY